MYIHHIYIYNYRSWIAIVYYPGCSQHPLYKGGQQGWSSPVCIVHQSKWAFSSDLTSSNWVN